MTRQPTGQDVVEWLALGVMDPAFTIEFVNDGGVDRNVRIVTALVTNRESGDAFEFPMEIPYFPEEPAWDPTNES